MATTHNSAFDFRLILPLPAIERASPRRRNAPEIDAKRPEAVREQTTSEKAVCEAREWRLVGRHETCDGLDVRWKTVAKKIGNSAEELRKRVSEGTLVEGNERTFSDNLSELRLALLESKEGIRAAGSLPQVRRTGSDSTVPRALAFSAAYLEAEDFAFREDSFKDFIEAVQSEMPLRMSEIWGLKPFLEFLLVEQVANALPTEDCSQADGPGSAQEPQTGRMQSLVRSVQQIADVDWKNFFEATVETERILRGDPRRVYDKMDFESREAYRAAVADMAERSGCDETEVARKAIELAREAARSGNSNERRNERRSHVGYYLVDAGQSALRREIGCRMSFLGRIREAALRWSDFFYLVGIEVVTIGVMALVVMLSHVRPFSLFALALFFLPAVECAVATMNLVATRVVRPKRLARLDFSDGIPGDCATVVAVPVLLTSEDQVKHAVNALEIRFLANRDPNLHFALLTDPPDSIQEFDEKDSLADLCSRLIGELNQKYGRENKGAFFHFHRHRTFNPAEELWMGWERKRGKLLDFNRFLLNEGDQFPVKVGDLSRLANVRYVITLDLDTQLPPEAGHQLVGTLAHPLNRAVIDPVSNTVVEGYGILQPRVDISVRSASRSRFASLLSGDTGFDIYSRAVSDVYQDLFGEGIFTGKGIYEVEAFQRVLEHRFPCNAVLSHDLIEGAYARAGLVSDIQVVDDYPSHFRAFSQRKHRWVRGDWQIIFGLLPRVRNSFGELVRNPLNHISRWKIIDNLRRSITEFATFALLLCGWLYLPGQAVRWTLTVLAIMMFPTYFQLAFEACTAGTAVFTGTFWRNLGSDFANAHTKAVFRLTFLCHQSLITADAIVRTLVRMKLTRKKLLEWETAADAEMATGRRHLVDVYLKWSPLLALAIGAMILALRPGSIKIALPFLILWASSNGICKWLNRPRPAGATRIRARDLDAIRGMSLRTWRFFREFSTRDENWLIPDIVQTEPPLVAHRISPTNLGLLLNARLAAHDLGYLTLDEFIADTERTLETVRRMSKFRGHLYNWYATNTLEPVEPLFVSTVDSGNLLSSLWTLKQGCLEMSESPLFPGLALWRGIQDHINLLSELTDHHANEEMAAAIQDLKQRFDGLAGRHSNRFDVLAALRTDVAIFEDKVSKFDSTGEIAWWTRELHSRVTSLVKVAEQAAPWLLIREFTDISSLPELADTQFFETFTLKSAPRMYGELIEKLKGFAESASFAGERGLALDAMRAAMARSERASRDTADRLASLIARIESIVDEMDFSFLYNPTRKMLSIGYEPSQHSISKYHYDLLASEARAGVFGAIAKADVPQECWLQLRRPYATYQGKTVLRSWSGTAFEYLMPCLWFKTYPNTLLECSSQAAIRVQQIFARKHGIPWGISESSCYQRNPDGHFRYHAFGVPDLALHRDDCSGDLVVAPYAAFLALNLCAADAVENLLEMKNLGWLSAYGFYEAADFTPRRVSSGRSHEVVCNWMAHHQGMSLVAAANFLCESAMQRRFHAEPSVAANECLLHEKQPRISRREMEEETQERTPSLERLGKWLEPQDVRKLVPKLS